MTIYMYHIYHQLCAYLLIGGICDNVHIEHHVVILQEDKVETA